MPRYYCDYCDTYLTHGSPAVRKQHNAGYKHKANVRNYYMQFEAADTQNMLDNKLKEYEARSRMEFQQFAPYGPRPMMPPGGMMRPGMPPGMPGMPGGMPGMPPRPMMGPGGPMPPHHMMGPGGPMPPPGMMRPGMMPPPGMHMHPGMMGGPPGGPGGMPPPGHQQG